MMLYALFGLLFLGGIGMANRGDGENSVVDFSALGATKKKNFSDKYDALFVKYGNLYGIDPYVLKAIAANESNVGLARSVARGIASPSDISGSVSSDGKSWGLMQTTLPTARQFESGLTEVALNSPEVSVRIAAKYIQWVKKNYGTDLEYVVRSYNGGPGWKKTALGPSLTLVYWNRFVSNFEKVKADGL